MEKASRQMDLEEWEILPDNGFFDEKRLFSREPGSDRKGAVDVNYVICPWPPTRRSLETPDYSSVPTANNQLIPVPIPLEPMIEKDLDQELVKDIGEVPMTKISVVPSIKLEKIKDPNWEADLDTISHVSFKKMKEPEFVEMKMDSPRLGGRGYKAQIDLGGIRFEEKDGELKSEDLIEQRTSEVVDNQETVGVKEKGIGFNIWKWRVNGIGALCSIGVATAAICIIIFGSHQSQKNQKHQNQKLQFQIFADEQRINQVVHHATRLHQAIPTVRIGFSLPRATVPFGGFREALEH